MEGIQHKLLIKLLGFNYTVEYKQGKNNKAADALSKMSTHSFVMPVSIIRPVWIEEVQRTYEQDANCLTKLSVAPNSVPHYTFKNGILRYKGKIVIGTSGPLRNQLLNSFHQSALGGHLGERATYQRIKLIFYWPKLKQDVIDHVKQCPVCQKNKSENTPYPGLLKPLPVPDKAWTHISMDFIEGLPRSQGKNVILVVVDRLTKYAHSYP